MMRSATRSTAGGRTSYRPHIDDIDAITPCPLPAPSLAPIARPSHDEPSSSRSSCSLDSETREEEHQQQQQQQPERSPSPSSLSDAMSAIQVGAFRSRRRDSVKALEEGTNGDPERLWKRMLALQQIYGCYRSARMSAALESGDISSLLRKFFLPEILF